MHHPAHPGLAQEEEDFTGAIDDAGRLSDEDSEFSMLEDEEPEPSGGDADELRRMHAMVAPHAANATPEETCQALEEVQNALLELSECWVSPLMIEDGVKSELFQFIPKEDHPLMAHHIFSDKFCHGIQCVHSEMVSNVKSTGGAIFGLLAEFFLRSFDCFKEPRCQKLLLSPNQKYTKFVPCLFPNETLAYIPRSFQTNLYTETAVEDVDDWELAYQNAFEGGLVATSSSTPSAVQYLSFNSTAPSCPPSPITHAASHPAIPMANMHVAGVAGPRSISTAMQDLALENGCAPPPPPPLPSPPFNPGAVPEVESEEAPGARGKARPKPQHKAKAMTTPDGNAVDQNVDHINNSGMAISNTRKTRQGGTRGAQV
ncbi:hypothetical protein EDC04DRAFT_2908324 [Pisolithus marmoratus]|nr:hypothetical protein EDC04DRAFT_2908324 [Pisolithus marmoratus]